MVAAPINLIELDERGIAYIAGTTFKVAQVAVETTILGMSVAEIQSGHPSLTRAQIHSALAYYYAHEETMEAAIAADFAEAQNLLARHGEAIDILALRQKAELRTDV